MAASLRDEEASNTVTPEEVRTALERILASKHFVHAPMKRKFLHLICEFYVSGRAGELNEYLIGREVFERDDNYNPAADPIVRVGAHDVRKKLELYYAAEGLTDEVRLEIPVGSYEPVFQRQTRKITPPEASKTGAHFFRTVSTNPRTFGKPTIALICIVAVLLSLVVILAVSNLNLRRRVDEASSPRSGTDFGLVWEPFLKSDDQALIVISNPPVFRFANPGDPDVTLKRAVGLTDEQTSDMANKLRDKFVIKQNRALRLILAARDYTGMGEAMGLFRITDLFRMAGKGLVLKQSRTATAEDLKNHNVILLGSVWANEWSGKLPLNEDFAYGSDATILNKRPLNGESAEYQAEFDRTTGELLVDYALVTVKPNISLDDTVMILAGIHSEGTDAAAEYVTSRTYLNEFNQRLLQTGGESAPLKYYQALLRVGVENGIPTTVALLALHELRAVQE